MKDPTWKSLKCVPQSENCPLEITGTGGVFSTIIRGLAGGQGRYKKGQEEFKQ